MTDETRPDREALRMAVASAIGASYGIVGPKAWAAADNVLALIPAPHPQGGIEALQALSEAATPGEWSAYFGIHGDPRIVTNPERAAFTTVAMADTGAEDYGRANALWIAATSNWVRALLAAAPAPTTTKPHVCDPYCPDDSHRLWGPPAPAPTEAPRVGSEWDGPSLAAPEPGRDGFWSYQECPRGVVTGILAHRRLGLVHRLRAADGRHACEDVIHPATSTSHHRSVAVEDTTADLAPTEAGDE